MATPDQSAPTKRTALAVQSASRPSLTARLDMRFAAPFRNAAFARRTWFSVTVVGIVLVHVAFLAFLLWRDSEASPRLAKLDETPVEIVVEPPQAKPTLQPAAAQPPIEKPATSAPRAANEETVDHDAKDKETHAPKFDAPKSDAKTAAAVPAAAPTPPDVQAKADPDPKPDLADPPKPPDVLQKDTEALDKLPPEPPKKPAKLAKPKPAPPKVRVAKSAAQQLAGSSELPDYTFAKPMRKHPKVTGGTEDDRYLAVVYGLITQNRRQIDMPGGLWFVAVAFEVDGSGNLVGLELQHSSGYRMVDAAALESVQRAAPFPPPPSGAPVGLVARLHSSQDPRAAQVSDD